MLTIAIDEAQARLPELTHEVDEGNEVLISREDGAVYQIVRRAEKPRPRFGSGRGMFVIRDDFDDPLEEMREYER